MRNPGVGVMSTCSVWTVDSWFSWYEMEDNLIQGSVDDGFYTFELNWTSGWNPGGRKDHMKRIIRTEVFNAILIIWI